MEPKSCWNTSTGLPERGIPMLNNFTFGQFFPGQSVIHRLDPRCKLVCTVLYLVLLFVVNTWVGFAVSAAYMAVVIAVSDIPVSNVLRGVKPILPIMAVTALLNLFFIDGNRVLDWGVIHISWEGIYFAIKMIIRLAILIVGTSMLTYTTSPIALTDGMEKGLRPLQKIHLPVHEVTMMMSIALRFIPTLVEETDKIMSAQKARGADFESGGLIHRAKALVPILIPLFISAFRRAEELALAMECRCYRGGEGRTRLRQLRYHWQDGIAYLSMVLLFALCVALNFLLPNI